MLRNAVGGMFVVLIAAPVALAINPHLTELRNQLKLVRQQEKETLAAIKARYHALINNELQSEKELARERTALKAEEKHLLGMIKTKPERDKLKKYYEALLEKLRLGIKLDKDEIKQLRAQEKLLTQQVKVAFGEQIQELEREIQALQQLSKTTPKK
jgi:hypothetical protein